MIVYKYHFMYEAFIVLRGIIWELYCLDERTWLDSRIRFLDRKYAIIMRTEQEKMFYDYDRNFTNIRFTARALRMAAHPSIRQGIKLIRVSALTARTAGVSARYSVSVKKFPVKLTAAVVCIAETASAAVR